ncbi:RNA polymerase sigma factor [Bacillus suaedaesalsae]|uniref:RNA polymerase sigma factor n=1 Tax=Bacillus suaedaesalsae TaxID=2810349 RepID=A0ABS2DKF7_9BACI|nr:sigma-70 family RNA polymerase sigma factor [Bacillus suaedaesalsae]MBM6618886.1 sigma-70 family RNA polymerase sigma factor [Bacillus suaedaesalsae]
MDYTVLYQQHYHTLYNAVHYIIKDHFLSEDIVQETFIKAYEKSETVKDEQKIGAWLKTVAKRTAIDFLRKQKRCSCDCLDEKLNIACEELTEKHVEWNCFKGEVEKEIRTLKKEQQQILTLKVNNGLKEREIASFLSLNPSTVKINTFRARKILKEKFQQHVFTA